MLATCILSSVLLVSHPDGMAITWHHEGPDCYVAFIRSNYLVDVITSIEGDNAALDRQYKPGDKYTLNTFTITKEGTSIKSYVPENQYGVWLPIVIYGNGHAKAY